MDAASLHLPYEVLYPAGSFGPQDEGKCSPEPVVT